MNLSMNRRRRFSQSLPQSSSSSSTTTTETKTRRTIVSLITETNSHKSSGEEEEEEEEERRNDNDNHNHNHTNAERLWELKRELQKELIFSENDTTITSVSRKGNRRKEHQNEERERERNSNIERKYAQRQREEREEQTILVKEASASPSSSSLNDNNNNNTLYYERVVIGNDDDDDYNGYDYYEEEYRATTTTKSRNSNSSSSKAAAVEKKNEKNKRTIMNDNIINSSINNATITTSEDGDDDDNDSEETSSQTSTNNIYNESTDNNKPPHVNAEMEMKLRRYELKHVDLELKLSASEEKVSEAALVLEEAEKTRDMYRKQCNRAWEEVKEMERDIELERKRVAQELSNEMLKQKQIKALKSAERFRLRGNRAYAMGDLSSAEGYYAEAISLLETSGMALIDQNHLMLRTNRAAALMALGRDSDALQECLNVLNVDEENIKALLQAAQSSLSLSNLSGARKFIERIALSSTASVDDLQCAQEQQQVLLRACVERDKSSGNDAYKRSDYTEALRLYTVALKDANQIVNNIEEIHKIKVGLYSNRAATHMMLGHPLKAAEDCCVALKFHPGNMKIQLRYARCLLSLGDFDNAFQEASDVLRRSDIDKSAKIEARGIQDDIQTTEKVILDIGELLKQFEEKRTSDINESLKLSKLALEELNKVAQMAPKIPILITLKAEALRFGGFYDEARSLLESNEPSDDPRRRALEARICFDLGYLSACIEAALPVTQKLKTTKSYNEAEENDDDFSSKVKNISTETDVPDAEKLILLVEQAINAQSSREKGKVLFKEGDYEEAMGVYKKALESCAESPMLQAIFLSNICACEQALERYVDALSSASIAILLAPTFAKARSRLATLYGELDMYKDAIDACNDLLELPLDHEEKNQAIFNKREIENRTRAFTASSPPPNWLKLLGLKETATTSDVKKAYRALALIHHPDKASSRNNHGSSNINIPNFANARREEVSSKLFKLVSEAHRILTNVEEREKWKNMTMKCHRASPAQSTSYSKYGSTARRGSHTPSSASTSSKSTSSRWDHYEI